MNPVQYRNVDSYVNAAAGDADITGDSIDASQFTKVSFLVTNTGTNTPAGNIYIQASDDNSTFVNASTAIAVSGAENNIITISDLCSRYIRFFYDSASGGASSTFTVHYTLKS